MRSTLIYLICFASSLLLWIFFRIARLRISQAIIQAFQYRHILNRHRFCGPWTLSSVIIWSVYISGNAAALVLGAHSFDEMIVRSGTLSLVNAAPLFLGMNLDYLSTLVGLSIRTYYQFHQACGLLSCALILCHSLIPLKDGIATYKNTDLYAISVSSVHHDHDMKFNIY